MSKKKSIIILCVITVLFLTLLCFTIPMNGKDSFQIGDSDYDFLWIFKGIKLGIDLKGGIYAEYECYRDDEQEVSDDDITGAISNLKDLLYDKGYAEALVEEVTHSGTKYVRVEVAGLEDTESLMNLIGDSATLTFRSDKDTIKMTGTGNIETCQLAYDTEDGYYLALQFNEQGTAEFAKITEEMTGQVLYIYIDDEQLMAPKVNSTITGGKASITGDFTYEEAYNYQVKIQAGITSVKFRLNTCESVSASLGEEAFNLSLIAAAIGIGIICIFLCLIYRGMGLAASCALLVYTELLLVLLAIVPWVELTLNGIAGVILSIGMAVDANVIIFERIKEVKTTGGANRMIPSAVAGGFKSAFVTILDANITTIIGAIIMLIFGSASIKSFALTLLIGIVLSLFTAIFITRIFINCFMAFDDENEKFYGLQNCVSQKDATRA